MNKIFSKKAVQLAFALSLSLAMAFGLSALTTAGTALAVESNAPVTGAATLITTSDATLNATNGIADADGHSFWVSTSSFATVANPSSIPDGVYSTPDMGAIAASTTFSASLSSLTTTGVPANLPAITPNTTYYFTAWSSVGGVWTPGEQLSFTTASDVVIPTDTTAPSTPTHVSPANGSVLTTAAMTEIDWSDSVDADSSPVSYVYQSSLSTSTNPDGSFETPAYTSGFLADSKIFTPGTPAGVYYWHVKAADSAAVPNFSPWTEAWKITIDNTPPPGPFFIDANTNGTFDSGEQDFSSLQAAVTAAVANDTIMVTGTSTVTTNINISKKLTIKGAAGAGINTTGADYVLTFLPGSEGSTVQGLTFAKQDTGTDDAMIWINANNISILSNVFTGKFNIGDPQTQRGLAISSVTGFNIDGNTFSHLRQPAYVNGATGNSFKQLHRGNEGMGHRFRVKHHVHEQHLGSRSKRERP